MTQTPEPSAQHLIGFHRHAGAFGCAVNSTALMDRLLEDYRRHAYMEGYDRAVSDVRAMLVWVAEDSLRRHGHAITDMRKVVYAFIERLERQIEDLPQSPFVEGGLGI